MNLTVPLQPRPNSESEGFWNATANGELALCWCPGCDLYQHPPLELCRFCGASTEFKLVSGKGVVYSYIVVHRLVAPGYLDRPGHVIALVELDEQEGLRLTTQLIDVEAADVEIGMPVRASIVPLPGGDLQVPMFRPAP